MEIFMALLMSIAVNLDNFMIGIRLGLDQKPVPLFPNLVISAFTGLFAGIFSGLPGILPPMAVTAANAAGAMMILAFGICCLCSRDSVEDRQLPGLSPKGACLLGISLAANCIPPAIGAGISGISSLAMALFCGICSFVCLHNGSRAGTRLRDKGISRHLKNISALLLIMIGMLELFTH